MNRARKRLLMYSVLSVFVLLSVLLTILNGINFTMAAQDADRVTEMLEAQHGVFHPAPKPVGGRGGRLGPMGPDSPEVRASVRYFTFAFPKGEGKAERVAFEMSAVTEEEAEAWARGLLRERTGWTRGTYRYRVYEQSGRTLVTVIDQGRELLPSYRILIISVCGEAVGLLLSFLFLLYAGKRLFAPLEDADRKQKEFIAAMEREFKLPLTVLSAETELLERAGGPTEHTRSIRRQLRQMGALLERLGSLSVFGEEADFRSALPLSELLNAELDAREPDFRARGLKLRREIQPGIQLEAEMEAVKRSVGELVDNTLRYALHEAVFRLRREGERILLEAENDAALPEGPCDQVFDRFTTLENAQGNEHVGLGLAAVKETVLSCRGRVSARVREGVFTLRCAL